MDDNTEDRYAEETNQSEEMRSIETPSAVEALSSLFAPPMQDCITVPDGGLVFRTTTGRPLLKLTPYEDGSRLDLYGAGEVPDIQIVATGAGCIMHLAQQGQSFLSLSVASGGGEITQRNPDGIAVSVLAAEGGGASLGLYDAEGQMIHLVSSAGPSVSPLSPGHFPPGMIRN